MSSDHGSYIPPELVFTRKGAASLDGHVDALERRIRDLEDACRSLDIQLRAALNRVAALERDRARRD